MIEKISLTSLTGVNLHRFPLEFISDTRSIRGVKSIHNDDDWYV